MTAPLFRQCGKRADGDKLRPIPQRLVIREKIELTAKQTQAAMKNLLRWRTASATKREPFCFHKIQRGDVNSWNPGKQQFSPRQIHIAKKTAERTRLDAHVMFRPGRRTTHSHGFALECELPRNAADARRGGLLQMRGQGRRYLRFRLPMQDRQRVEIRAPLPRIIVAAAKGPI